jgi:HNH endonuclease
MSVTPIPATLRMHVLSLWGERCLACGGPYRVVMDHVVPESWGGPTDVTNLQPLCGPCNERKGYASCADHRPAGHPVMEQWRDEGRLTYSNIAPPAHLGLTQTSNGWVPGYSDEGVIACR